MQTRSVRFLLLLVVSLAAGCTGGAVGTVEKAFSERLDRVQVTGEGTVDRMLRDDRQGSPHQRFIIRLASGQTVLIEHNIDVAQRIEGLKEGDTLAFSGEYVWNDKGGLIHWTHHDPAARHTGGWLKHNGRTYE